MDEKRSPDPNAYYQSPLAVAAYDLFAGRGTKGDLDFYLGCARRFGAPVLTVGAGTGRLLVRLAEAGFDTVGLDNSRPMLDCAFAKLAARPDLAARVRLTEADMADFDLGQEFPLVIVAGRGFQHLTDPARQRAALRCMRRHLRDGGILVLDLFDPHFELMSSPASRLPATEMADPANDTVIRRTVLSRSNDFAAQTVTETLLFERLDAADREIESAKTSWTLRWSTRQETAYLLELCGFEIVAQHSDFSGAPPRYGHEQLWVARAVR